MITEEEKSIRLENQLCFPLYAVSRKVIALYQPYLKQLDITYTQYIVLMALWESENITVSELGKKLFLDNGTLTPLLKKMEKQGYLSRKRSHRDERMVIISLTAKGHGMKEKCIDIPRHIAEKVNIDLEEAQQLHSLLYGVLKKISD